MMQCGKIISSRFGSFGRFCSTSRFVSNQVMVSQSEDRWANHALEDWVCKNKKNNVNNILVLSKSKGLASSPPNIKATFIGQDLLSACGSAEVLVYSCLSPGLSLSRLPSPPLGLLEEEGCHSFSVTLELAEEVDNSAVMKTFQNIGERFSAAGTAADGFARVSLVRPDDGWFPGIGKIQAELEEVVQDLEMEARKRKERVKRVKSEEFQLLNSFGH